MKRILMDKTAVLNLQPPLPQIKYTISISTVKPILFETKNQGMSVSHLPKE